MSKQQPEHVHLLFRGSVISVGEDIVNFDICKGNESITYFI